MTALAVALVLCCAMVCGTVLACRLIAQKREDSTEAVMVAVREVRSGLEVHSRDIQLLTSDVIGIRSDLAKQQAFT